MIEIRNIVYYEGSPVFKWRNPLTPHTEYRICELVLAQGEIIKLVDETGRHIVPNELPKDTLDAIYQMSQLEENEVSI